MITKFGKHLLVLPILSLLVACAQMSQLDPKGTEGKEIAQNAKTHSDHSKLASYYDDRAKEMITKAEEKKGSLEEYNDHSYYYGRQGQDFKSHTLANIRYYEQAAQEASNQANFHRQVAAELLKQEYAKQPTETPDQQGKHKIKARLNSNSTDSTTESSIQ